MLHHTKHILRGIILTFLLIAAQPASAQSASDQGLVNNSIQRISTGTNGFGGGAYSVVSADGRFIVFESAAGDLLPGQVQDSWDTLAYDLTVGTMERVSTRSGGQPVYNPGDYTSPPAISADGRFVAFMSRSEDLVANDHNGMPDIFVHDRTSDTTAIVSVAPDGSPGNGPSFNPAISADGRFIAFQSLSNNLVSGDTNDSIDIFVRDLQQGTTELVSVTDSGSQGVDPHEYGFSSVDISADGRFVAFSYQHLPLPDQSGLSDPAVYLRDRQAGTTRLIAPGELPALSPDGRFLVFVTSTSLVDGDRNNGPDVYRFDRDTSAFEQVSLPAGQNDAPMQEIFSSPDISQDGKQVVFESTGALTATAVEGTSNIFIRDLTLRETTLITTGMDGSPSNGASHTPTISADASVVAFTSLASNLVSGDTNQQNDVFVYNRSEPGLTMAENAYYLPLVMSQ